MIFPLQSSSFSSCWRLPPTAHSQNRWGFSSVVQFFCWYRRFTEDSCLRAIARAQVSKHFESYRYVLFSSFIAGLSSQEKRSIMTQVLVCKKFALKCVWMRTLGIILVTWRTALKWSDLRPEISPILQGGDKPRSLHIMFNILLIMLLQFKAISRKLWKCKVIQTKLRKRKIFQVSLVQV
jgi:hypothetical protein